MRKHPVLLGVAGIMVLVMLVIALPAAASELPGISGVANPHGASAAGVCGDCHNAGTMLKAKELQYDNSKHANGIAFARSQADCAYCHTNEGFNERTDKNTTKVAAVANPTPPGCRTCHNIHETYTASDWALKTTAPVKLLINAETIDMGKGNLCVNCHQPRDSYKVPTVGGGDVKVTSSRFGPHHGNQSTMLTGKAGYGEFTGFSAHATVPNGCVTCHMATPYGAEAGGHSMNLEYDAEGAPAFNTNGCQKCHPGLTNVNHNGKQAMIQTMTLEVKNLLMAKGYLDKTGMVVPGTYSSQIAGAIWNYQTVMEDKSGGVHNPQYAQFLLQTAKDAVK